MIVPDANLLLYAYDESSPDHAAARSWWETVMNGDEPIGLPWVVILAFVRLATHPTVAANPRSVPEVREIVDSWVAAPHVRILHGTGQTMKAFFDALEGAKFGGNLCTDAMIAALAMESGARVFTGCRVTSYCLMDNHFHLLLEVPPMVEGGLTDEGLLKRLSARLPWRQVYFGASGT